MTTVLITAGLIVGSAFCMVKVCAPPAIIASSTGVSTFEK